MRRWQPLALLTLGICILGCADEDGSPAPKFAVTATADAGPDTSHRDQDAGIAMARDASVPEAIDHCFRLSTPSQRSPGLSTYVDAPRDFVPQWLALRWSSDCTQMQLTLGEGSCLRPATHQLTFVFDGEAVANHAFSRGEMLLPVDGLSVRYRRPGSLTPSGSFGCARVEGTLSLTQTLSLAPANQWSAGFQLTLRACAGTQGVPQDIVGSFSAQPIDPSCGR